ncbi:ABC transporter ATP-binding protein [Cuneatibacter caecimuris]|uniref:ABC-2 type transport system ATP-binding protein n=1 Tax=Cuneatibacter caecimuris TaxID=1796618 RepID=A0A4Q7NZ65_9FIRM|nr:ABC transporter ATP-binding protein [Cuneatibacter caecimuris]RZS92756.1 ABC-2 type transport system ATP-binding protein [Cuneatibacter caecimuris]
MIEVKDLVKRYGNHMAVDHLSFTVEKGQIYGFLGPNGAGKSTTMNIMTGYIAATSGQVLINGHDILEEPEEAKKCIGYLPEIPPLYTDMTVSEYLLFAARLKKIPAKEQKAQILQAAEMVKITDVADRLIKNLSKGYKQRVGLAQAVLGMPEILILDEPTVGLDPKQIIEIRELIRELAKNHTVILSSHILSEIQEVCNYILIISGGKLVASDTPERLEQSRKASMRLKALIRADRDQLEGVLKQIPGIRSWTTENGNEAGCLRTDLEISEGEDVRDSLFYALAEAKCPIYELRAEGNTLEDIFLKLTGENAENLNLSEEEFSEKEVAAELPEDSEETEETGNGGNL